MPARIASLRTSDLKVIETGARASGRIVAHSELVIFRHPLVSVNICEDSPPEPAAAVGTRRPPSLYTRGEMVIRQP